MSFRHNLPPLPSVPDTFEQLPSTQEKPAIAPSVSLSRPTTVVPVTHHASETPVHETEHVEVDTVPAQIAKVATAATAEVVDSDHAEAKTTPPPMSHAQDRSEELANATHTENGIQKSDPVGSRPPESTPPAPANSDPTNPLDEPNEATRDTERHEPPGANEDPEETPVRAGGPNDPPKPPTKTPGAPSTPEPEEPSEPTNLPSRDSRSSHTSEPQAELGEPVDHYQRQLKNIVRFGKDALEYTDDFTQRDRVSGRIMGSNTDLAIVEQMPPTPSDRQEEVVEAAIHRARNTIATIEQSEGAPDDKAIQTAYSVTDAVSHANDGASIGVQVVSELMDDASSQERMTVTTIAIPSTEQEEERLDVQLHSKDGEVVAARIVAIPAEEVSYYNACIEMFGKQGFVADLLHGKYNSEEELVEQLKHFVAAALQMNMYPPQAVILALEHAVRIGGKVHADQTYDDGLRSARFNRINQHLATFPYYSPHHWQGGDPDAAPPVVGAGGVPNPPVDPPNTPRTPEPGEPEEPNLAKRHGGTLDSLVRAAEHIVEQSHWLEGKTRTIGIHTNGVYDMRVRETMIGAENVLDRIEKVQARAVKALAAQRILWQGIEPPVIAAYHMEDNFTNIPDRRGTVDVHRVSTLTNEGEPDEEIITLTTIEVLPTQRSSDMLHCEIYTREHAVIDAQLTSIPKEDIPAYQECIATIGNRSAVIEVLHGNFETPQQAADRLRPLVEARRQHPGMQERVDRAVGEAIRIGTAAKAERVTSGQTLKYKLQRLRARLTN